MWCRCLLKELFTAWTSCSCGMLRIEICFLRYDGLCGAPPLMGPVDMTELQRDLAGDSQRTVRQLYRKLFYIRNQTAHAQLCWRSKKQLAHSSTVNITAGMTEFVAPKPLLAATSQSKKPSRIPTRPFSKSEGKGSKASPVRTRTRRNDKKAGISYSSSKENITPAIAKKLNPKRYMNSNSSGILLSGWGV